MIYGEALLVVFASNELVGANTAYKAAALPIELCPVKVGRGGRN
jgi:hypothetical protein